MGNFLKYDNSKTNQKKNMNKHRCKTISSSELIKIVLPYHTQIRHEKKNRKLIRIKLKRRHYYLMTNIIEDCIEVDYYYY
jgi:hypothetical protein